MHVLLYIAASSYCMNEPYHIYCISGLGADFRIFANLHIPHAVLHPIEWLMPEAGEALPAFAARLSHQIFHPNPILLGVSFGGMLATEISNLLPVQKTIIVSSAKSRPELPWYMRVAGRMRLHKVVPYWLVAHNKALNRFIFDTRSKAEELYLKKIMLQQTDSLFIRRSVDMILRWQRTSPPDNIIHIHGQTDKLLLPGQVRATHWIPQGGHFMVWNMAAQVSAIIHSELAGLHA